MFTETTRWDCYLLLGMLIFFAIGVAIIIATIKEWKTCPPSENKAFLFWGIANLIIGVMFIGVAKITVIESQPVDYELKEPLRVSMSRGFRFGMDNNKDINGLTIVNNGDFGKMVDYINFKKGEVIKIKTIEEYDITTKNDKRNWRNARVYVTWGDKLLELTYDDITKQDIDELLMSMYDEK